MAGVSEGFFPLDERLQMGQHCWTPETVKQIVKLGTEIPSYRRAAQNFSDLTQVGVSKSRLGELVKLYGGQIVDHQEAEAAAMGQAPAQEEVSTVRQMAQPDREVMALSMDGAMVNIRGEGWKEVKTVCVSAVDTQPTAETGQVKVRLSHHSYRSGVWEAKEFANQQWAEGCRRGLERAKQIVSINDGALWIWLIVQMCWAPCVEILDWWHAVQKLWDVARALLGDNEAATAQWMAQQKSHLWHSQLRQVFRAIRQLCPRGDPLPDKVRAGVGYLFRHRGRLRYQQFREAGYPLGSGSVESACKLVMQERMKQAGMRWSRDGAQAMLALRSVLLSQRWDEVWATLHPSPKLT